MDTPLRRFAVRLALTGLSREQALAVLPEMQEEFEARTHLARPRVTWDGDSQRLVFEVEDVDIGSQQAAMGAWERSSSR